MASQSASNDVAPEQISINLQIVSPSVGVNRPLHFPTTPASTSIKALKGMIRDVLPLKPADHNQRLIYRGKALLRDEETLLDVFGAESLRTADQHTIHLVLRDVDQPPAPTPTSAANAQNGSNLPRPVANFLNHLGAGLGRAPAEGAAPQAAQPGQPNVQPRMPSPAPLGQQLPPPAAAAFQQQHQQLTSWLNQVQREAMTRAVNQNQRGRAQAGMRGVADPARDPSSRRGSPAPTHTIYRETQGPNGRSYHMETVIRNPTTVGNQNGAYSVADIQNMVRNADSSQGAAAAGIAMQRTASGASVPLRSAPSILNMASAPQPGSQPRQGLELYLLSSPEGPRGILINNSTMETFYTPRNTTPAPTATTPRRQMTVREFLLSPPDEDDQDLHAFQNVIQNVFPNEAFQNNAFQNNAVQNNALQNNAFQNNAFRNNAFQNNAFQNVGGEVPEIHRRNLFNRFPNQNQAPAQAPIAQPPPAIPPQNPHAAQAAVQPLHAANPMAGFGQLLLGLAPHFWNILRLGFFVWIFVGEGSSWTRWFIVVSAAIFIFVLGTGALNGMGEHFWRPMVRHLESLFPTLDRPNQRQPVPAAQPEMDPANMAARLVAERNERRPWFSEQMRRVERAGLLFLASIAPGVAERHIANLEEEARREERRRREAEEAAAAAAREAERQANENSQEEVTAESSQQGATRAIENNREEAPAREPLVAL